MPFRGHTGCTGHQAGFAHTAALLLVAALTLAVLPAVALAQPQPVETPNDACPDDVNPPAPFIDRLQIPDAHRLNVDCAFNNEITLGTGDLTYQPRVIVRRDQFSSFMVRTLEAAGVVLPAPSDQGFADIAGNAHEGSINIIAQTGITVGTSATTYSPANRLRRDQIASLVLRAVAFIEDVPLSVLQRETGPFADVPASNVHARNINGARALNLTIGRSAGTYAPSDGTRRDQMASFLIRLLAALSEGSLIPAEDRAQTLDLTPQTATNPTGTAHTVRATVRDDTGALLTDANVHFQVYRAAAADGTFSGPTRSTMARTNAQGRATFTYTGPATSAQDWIVACAARPTEPCAVTDQQAGTEGVQFTGAPQVAARVSDTATKTWLHPDDRATQVTFSQALAINAVGTPHSATVTVRDTDARPVQGANVRFEVYRDNAATPANTYSGPVAQGNTTTNAQGRATFTYTGPGQTAEDRIVACVPRAGSCRVTDQQPATAGTQFTGTPTVGSQPHAVGTKRWVVAAAATSLSAQAYGLNVSLLPSLLGGPLIDEIPDVAIAIPPAPDVKEETDELLEVPASPLTEIGALRVAARGNRIVGFAQGEAEAVDVELLFSGGDPLITADALRAVSTSTCPTAGTLARASEGSQFVNLTIGGTEIPLTPAPNTTITIPGIATVVIHEVVPDPAGPGHGFTVRALRVTLLAGITGVGEVGAEIIVGEAHSRIVCA